MKCFLELFLRKKKTFFYLSLQLENFLNSSLRVLIIWKNKFWGLKRFLSFFFWSTFQLIKASLQIFKRKEKKRLQKKKEKGKFYNATSSVVDFTNILCEAFKRTGLKKCQKRLTARLYFFCTFGISGHISCSLNVACSFRTNFWRQAKRI